MANDAHRQDGPDPKVEDGSARRFLIASIAALAVDLVLTLVLRQATSLSLTASAALSFVLVGALFYFIHEFWTFRRAGSGASAKRLVQNLSALAAAFVSRVATIGILELSHTPGTLLGAVYFLAGAGVSFSVNYLANRFWVFRS